MRARIFGRGVAREQMAGLTGLQQMQLLLDGEAPAPPISETLDFALIEVAHGRAIFQGKPSPRLLNPLGTVHGGWYAPRCWIQQSAAPCTPPCQSGVPIPRWNSAQHRQRISLKVPLVRAEGYTVRIGAANSYAEGRLYGADGTLCARVNDLSGVRDAG